MYKYKRNGFTLVELMAVIIIISLIALLTFPNIINQIKKTKKSNNKMIEDVVIEQAKKYFSDNKDEFDKGIYVISVQDLIDSGYITDELVKGSNDNIQNKYIIYKDKKYIVTANNYIELEYIKSSGTQYIDTLYTPKINTKLELDIKFSNELRSDCATIFSSSNSETSVFQLNFGASSSTTLYPWIDKPYGKGGNIESFNITHYIRQNKNTITMQSGMITYGTVSGTLSTKTSDNDISLILFGSRNCIFNAFNMYVYGLKLYEGDRLVRNYIPVLDSTGVACLYEKVEGKFYYNQGTGNFIYSMDEQYYKKINYLESTGTQWINTEFNTITPETGYYVKYQNSQDHSGDDTVMGVLNPNRAILTSNKKVNTAWKQSGFGSDGSAIDVTSTNIIETWLNYENNNISKISLNGEVKKSESISTVTSTNNRSCYIFATNYNGNAYGNASGVRVYGAKISLNNEIVRDYIPVLDLNNKPCLFDKVGKECYYNQGTGEFLYG